MSTPQPEIRIIGVGNPLRGDDGVGLTVAQRVRERITGDAAIFEESGDGAALLELWKGAEAVILVDAVYSGEAPGTVHRLDASVAEIPSRMFRFSTHGFGLAEAVEMARALNRMPARLMVFGIEGKNFTAGAGLSPEVEQAAIEVAGSIVEEIRTVHSLTVPSMKVQR